MTTIEMAQTGRKVYLLHGELERARFLSALRAVRKCTSISRGGELFPQPVVVRKSGYVQRYEELIRQNQLFFTLDIIKDKLANAYKQTDEAAMAEEISDIMDICTVTKNKHLLWFRRILDEHFEGIIAHATFNISAGRIEGINNKIKTPTAQGLRLSR